MTIDIYAIGGGTSNRVVSIPEHFEKDSVIKHPELEDLEIKVIRHWASRSPLQRSSWLSWIRKNRVNPKSKWLIRPLKS